MRTHETCLHRNNICAFSREPQLGLVQLSGGVLLLAITAAVAAFNW